MVSKRKESQGRGGEGGRNNNRTSRVTDEGSLRTLREKVNYAKCGRWKNKLILYGRQDRGRAQKKRGDAIFENS